MVGCHLQLVGQVGFEDRAALVGVGAVEADHDRRVDLHPLERLHDAVGDLFALGDATEDVDEDRPHVGVAVDHLERARHHVGVGAAADVEEVGRLPPTWLTMSTVLMARPAPLAITPTEPSSPTYCRPFSWANCLARVAHLGGVVLGVVGVTEYRVVVEGDLGVERVHPAVGREDQRVDLDEVGVALGVGACTASAGCRPRRRWPRG